MSSSNTQKSLLLHINEIRETEQAEEDDTHHLLSPSSRSSSSSSSSSPFLSSIRKWRRKIFKTLHDPSSSLLARYVHVFLAVVVLISSVSFMISTLPFFWYHHNDTQLYDVEIFVICVFTVEYVLSILTAPKWYRWMIEPLSIVDLLAVVPFYYEVLDPSVRIRGFAVLRVVRLVRMLWLLKFATFSATLATIGETFRRSGEAMIMLVFLLSITVTIYSSAVFFAEQTVSEFDNARMAWIYKESGDRSPFESIFHSMWWCIITLTTVGYGDVVPISPLGKAIASFASVTGAIVLAFPVTILGANIVMVREEHHHHNEEKEWNEKLSRADQEGMSEVAALSYMEEEYQKLSADISTLETTLTSLRVRRERMSVLLDFLRESCLGKIASPSIHRRT